MATRRWRRSLLPEFGWPRTCRRGTALAADHRRMQRPALRGVLLIGLLAALLATSRR